MSAPSTIRVFYKSNVSEETISHHIHQLQGAGVGVLKIFLSADEIAAYEGGYTCHVNDTRQLHPFYTTFAASLVEVRPEGRLAPEIQEVIENQIVPAIEQSQQ
ncbi:hypothetical protein O0I10_007743 [Lichtheimia ornata]|uniref:Uncharacterized protein n=1 Tax=Lichtheimia ornata TaxID=688661 RepID=A0AAD7UZT6_9FUNG|nr:uncharacterized protein O0I10_007743 [Lichtheimia ornata]KAJ8656664.1 hypothetical protein O0I10_007743 [Lichtheimia ornata]